jgi:hypothetical protein
MLRAAFAAVLVLCVALVAPASGAPASGDVLVLGATNRFELPTESAARVIVEVPRDTAVEIAAPPSQCPSPALRITGTAEHVVVQLLPHPYAVGYAPLTIARVGGVAMDDLCVFGELKAGTYTLDVVHSSGTAQLEMDLPDLVGDVVVTEEDFTTTTASMTTLAAVEDPTADTGTTTIWGGYTQLAGQGSVLVAGWFDPAAATGVATDGTCLTEGPPPLPEWVAFGPTCQDGSTSIPYRVNASGGAASTRMSSKSNIKPGMYGASLWATNTVPGTAVAVAIPFE